MSKTDTKMLIRAFIEEEKENKRSEFQVLGSGGKHYTPAQKDYAIKLAEDMGVRAAARTLNLHRKTLQRWLRVAGIYVKRCPDWVHNWAYWRKKRREKWERIKSYRGY